MQPSGWSQCLCLTFTMPGSLCSAHLIGSLVPGMPYAGRFVQPSGWSQHLLIISTMLGSL